MKLLGALLMPLAFGLALSLLLVSLLGENPVHVLSVLVKGAFGSVSNFGYTLFYATPLVFTGLSVVWALKVGLFNIGAEGQMNVGACALIAVSLSFPNLQTPIAIVFGISAAFLGGAAWGALAGLLKSFRGTHEVLGTILLNFVSYGITAYFVLDLFRNPEAMNPETQSIGLGYRMSSLGLGGDSPLNQSLLLAVIICVVTWLVLKNTTFGFNQRFVGGNSRLASWAGISPARHQVLALAIAGGIAGLACLNEILGYAYKLKEGFSGGAGFTGIAVALIARTNPLGVIPAAILFGALHKGALNLDLDTEKVSRDLALVVQALVILGYVSYPKVEELFIKLRSRYPSGI